MKLRFSKVTLASSAAAVVAAGAAAMAATGTLPSVLTSGSDLAKPAKQATLPQGGQHQLPSVPEAPQLPDAKVPDAKAPGVPGADKLPARPGDVAVPKPSCDSVPPAVRVGNGIERTFATAAGLRYANVKAGHVTIHGARSVCETTQTWASRVKGQDLRVTTLSTPSGTKLADLARGLRLVDPKATNVGGHSALAGSTSDTGGYGVLWARNGSTAIFVSGGSGLPGGAEKQVMLVSKAVQQAR